MDRQLLAIKKEATYGTEAAPAAADAIWAENVQFRLLGTRVTADPAKPSLSAVPGVIYGQHAELSFDVQLTGSGTAGVAPLYGKLLKAAGLAEAVVEDTSVTYSILADPDASDSVTIHWSDAKRLHKMLGARGKIDWKFVAGQPPRATLTFRGLHVPVAARATVLPADADFDGWLEALPIQQALTTFELNEVELGLRELTVNGADNVKFADLPGQKNVRLLGARNLTGNLKATMPALADFNPETQWVAGAKLPFTLIHGTTAGNIVTINGKGQIDTPAYSREDGEDVVTMPISLVGSDLATDDDFELVLT